MKRKEGRITAGRDCTPNTVWDVQIRPSGCVYKVIRIWEMTGSLGIDLPPPSLVVLGVKPQTIDYKHLTDVPDM